MPDIFLTSTFRNDWNRAFNLRVDEYLTAAGYKCFLPQRDSYQGENKKRVFDEDIAGLDNSRMVLAIAVKTQTANWGFEIGYARAHNKPVVILTDKEHPAELMPSGGASEIITVDNLDEIKEYGDRLVHAISRMLTI